MKQAEQLHALATASQSVLLTGPASADGDSIGATLALGEAIHGLGVPRVDVAADVPTRYQWMPGAKAILNNEEVRPVYDLVIVMDGDRHRLAPAVEDAFRQAKHRVVVDHHRTTSSDGYDLAILDASAAATCSQVLTVLDDWGVTLSSSIAENLYVGLIFDTGGFRYSNTTPDTHRAAARLIATGFDHAQSASRILMDKSPGGMKLHALVTRGVVFHGGGQLAVGCCRQEDLLACGAELGDLDGLVESLLYVDGVELSLLLVEKDSGGVKLSFRSRGLVDVAALARSLTERGGGHAKAAGAFLEESMTGAEKRLPDVCLEAIAQARGRRV